MNKRTILIFAYYSFKDPVFQSAVLPYFINFPEKEGYQFILLTFEQERYRISKCEEQQARKELAEHHIHWVDSKWHSGRFKLFKKIYDLVRGVTYAVRLVRKYRVDAIYSEGFPGAVIAHFVALISRKPHIVHTFEPHTDYMIEAGVWNKSSWEARLLHYFEKVVALGAHTIMTATNGMIEKLKPITRARIYRVPSCVDLDHFKFLPGSRKAIREKHGIRDEEIVIVYLGKFGGMYWDREVFEFFQACLQKDERFRFFVFTPEDLSQVEGMCAEMGIPAHKIKVGRLTRNEVPHYLSASDFGLVPVRQYASKKYCSPIKDGEYWACGLPIIIPEGISDDYKHAQELQLGVVIRNTQPESIEKAAEEILQFSIAQPAEITRDQCRNFVFEDRNVEKYKQLYHEVFSGINCHIF